MYGHFQRAWARGPRKRLVQAENVPVLLRILVIQMCLPPMAKKSPGLKPALILLASCGG